MKKWDNVKFFCVVEVFLVVVLVWKKNGELVINDSCYLIIILVFKGILDKDGVLLIDYIGLFKIIMELIV